MEGKAPNCKWCGNEATRMDYRDIDGIVSKIPTCDDCFHINTETLISWYCPSDCNRKNICVACQQLEAGVKFRIAPIHTCGIQNQR